MVKNITVESTKDPTAPVVFVLDEQKVKFTRENVEALVEVLNKILKEVA